MHIKEEGEVLSNNFDCFSCGKNRHQDNQFEQQKKRSNLKCHSLGKLEHIVVKCWLKEKNKEKRLKV
jgi:transcription elongation factor Elf1